MSNSKKLIETPAEEPPVPNEQPEISIPKPGTFDLDKFKSKRAAAIAGVETLQTALPHHNIAQSVVVCDFEYEAAAGDLPNVLCMVAYELDEKLRHVRTIRLWRDEFGAAPPFDIGPDALFVA